MYISGKYNKYYVDHSKQPTLTSLKSVESCEFKTCEKRIMMAHF